MLKDKGEQTISMMRNHQPQTIILLKILLVSKHNNILEYTAHAHREPFHQVLLGRQFCDRHSLPIGKEIFKHYPKEMMNR